MAIWAASCLVSSQSWAWGGGYSIWSEEWQILPAILLRGVRVDPSQKCCPHYVIGTLNRQSFVCGYKDENTNGSFGCCLDEKSAKINKNSKPKKAQTRIAPWWLTAVMNRAMSGQNANLHLLLLLLLNRHVNNSPRKGQSCFSGTKYCEISESLDNKEAVKRVMAVGSPLNRRGESGSSGPVVDLRVPITD